ncbi:hypothetical protein BDR03DRAFT_176667 [Suillus americanus]|nr:hypothetical protein BDR03DRAFT_176667 [Suillus americanus]
MFHSDKLPTAMLLVWMTENDHMFSSFASAGSRKRRRSRNHGQSMMTNSRMMKRKKIRLLCLLPGFSVKKSN